MTRTLHRVGHSAVHGLAMRTGCRCPDCGCGPRTATAYEEDAYGEAPLAEDADEALRRAAGVRVRRPARRPAAPAAAAGRRTARARRPFRQPDPLAPAQRSALRQTVRSFGWTGFRPTPGRRANMQHLASFQAAGGVAPAVVRGRRHMTLTPEGRRLLREDPRFRHLAPLFSDAPGQRIYEIAPAGRLDRPHYIGKSGRRPGERLLEHLNWGSDRTHRELRDAQRDGRLDQLQVADGRFTISDRGRRSHLGEVALMELMNPDWNDPRRHGFDAESDDLDW